MSAYVDAARSILAFVERCVDRPAARSAAVRSVAAHRHLDERRLAFLVNFYGYQKLVLKPLDGYQYLWHN